MCAKCQKRQGCKTPCAFVDEILKEDNPQVFERHGRDSIAGYPQWREVQESVLRQVYSDSGKPDEIVIFTTECESPFARSNPKLEHTRVFMLHFFGWQSCVKMLPICLTPARSA